MKSWMDAIQSKAFYNRETVTVVNISSVEGHWTHTVSQLIGFCPVPVCYYGWDGGCPHLWLGVGLACLSWVPLKTSLPIFGCAWSAWNRIFCPLLLKLATSMEPIGELCAETNNKKSIHFGQRHWTIWVSQADTWDLFESVKQILSLFD